MGTDMHPTQETEKSKKRKLSTKLSPFTTFRSRRGLLSSSLSHIAVPV